MKKNILYTLALLSIFASCAKTELPHFGGENDPNAVVISPSVAVLSSKSNPLGDYDAQKKFNEGDVITIKDKSDNAVYKYALGSDGRWKPTDGKCLLWHDETLDIEAYYGTEGEDPYRRVLDQSDAAKIAAADYMTCQGCEPFPRILGNELMFTLERRKALVTVVIDSYGNQYNPNTDFITELSIGDIKPYIRNKNDEYSPNSGGTIGYKYSAIIPQDLSFSITYKIGQDLRIVDLTSNTNFGAGNSYTINLRVGKDKLEVGDISVSDWGSTDWDDAEADIDAPYVTFSADSEQKFKIYFGIDFELGSGEYFEYSVGGGKWTSFTGTLENVTFGGSNGDLLLRGKSSKGTAIDDYYGCGTIRFHDASVPVYCTGDIRTLIDYEAYGTVSTADAKFCGLFSDNTMLRTAPELPATTLASQCYAYMFQGCSELTAAPVLPAEILAENCYEYMFYGCTALSSVTMKATDVSATSCLNNWLNNAGTSAASRTLTMANETAYNSIESFLPDNWKQGAENTTVNFQNN